MTFNDAIRAAAGRGRSRADEPTAERVAGDVGIGRGGAAAPPRPRLSNDEINETIRAASSHVRGRLTIDDLWVNH